MKKLNNVTDYEIRLIRVFKAVVECGGITASELSLNKRKSAISTDISDLEKRLGMTLCNRGRSGFSLTPEGNKIYKASCTLLNNIDHFRNEVQKAQIDISGELVLYVSDNAVWDERLKLSQAISEFHMNHPNSYIKILSGDPIQVEQAILSGKADLGINVIPRVSSSLNITKLFDEKLYLYCGFGHPLFSTPDEDITVEKTQKYNFIEIVTMNDEAIIDYMSKVNITASAKNLDMRASMILSGYYLGFLPPYMGKKWLLEGKMRAVLPEKIHTSNAVCLLTKKSQEHNPAREIFSNIYKKIAG
ncbi:LysR family transcriptional regulator [Halomonas sp. KAO]|uniref:LysR family transcriptional regulator n=1 Tax=Halomonas sp. KAO TaxID=2783858 RepID=UPI00189DD03F|nr:LysR family transcriptional regulator [Halomonas sp. KAO]MBF7051907.1 LysR family transcriptional regulator [Halomonas sp. KAO]